MKYIYAALLLHEAGKEINEENLKSVLSAAGVEAEDAMVKAVVSALKEVNIDEAIKEATTVQTVVAAQPQQGGEEKKEEKKEEEEKEVSADEAVAGLGALFG